MGLPNTSYSQSKSAVRLVVPGQERKGIIPEDLTHDRPHVYSPQSKLYKINKISDLEATLGTRGFCSISPDLLFHFFPAAEPLACAIHGVDVIQPKVGSEGGLDDCFEL